MADLCKMVEVGLNENGNLFYDLFPSAEDHARKKAALGVVPEPKSGGPRASRGAFPSFDSSIADDGLNIKILNRSPVTKPASITRDTLRETIAASVFDLDDIDALKVERDENDQRKEPTISERVALAEAIAVQLGKRQGQRTDLATSGNISGSDRGETKDIAAAKAGLGSGKTLEAAQKVVERGAPELVEAMDAGKVSIHAAATIAALPPATLMPRPLSLEGTPAPCQPVQTPLCQGVLEVWLAATGRTQTRGKSETMSARARSVRAEQRRVAKRETGLEWSPPTP